MNLLALLRTVSLAQLRVERVKSVLMILGLALGIAVFYAITSATDNAWRGFSHSVRLFQNESPFRLSSAAGEVAENIVPAVLSLPEVESVSPRSGAFVRAHSDTRDLGTIQLIGVDFFGPREPSADRRNASMTERSWSAILPLLQRPGTVLVSPAVRSDLGGDALSIRLDGEGRRLEVIDVLEDFGLAKVFGGRVALMDIAHFQDLTRSWGRIDTLNIFPARGVSRSDLKRALRPVLPTHVELEEEGDTERHANKMTEAFQLNLRFLSCISLFVALLLIYNTVSYSTLKRKTDLSILRSIGASSSQIFRLLTVESILLGLLGAVAGITLGYLLSFYTVKVVASSFSTLYLPVTVGDVRLNPRLAAICVVLGPTLAFAGSLFPILEVASLPPRETSAIQRSEARFRRRLGGLTALGLLCAALSAFSARAELLRLSIYTGFLSPSFLLLSAVLLTAPALYTLTRFGRGAFKKLFGAEVLLALDHVRMTLSRSAMAVSAMVIALAMYLGVSTMIQSFRVTVEGWIEHITKADVYVSASQSIGAGTSSYLPDQVIDFLRSAEFTQDADSISGKRVLIAGRYVRVNGVAFASLAAHERLLLKHSTSPEVLTNFSSDPVSVLVSETFSERTGLRRGDQFEIPGLQATHSAVIADVFYDYSSDQGVVYMPDTVFERVFNEPRKQGVSLYLRPGVAPEEARRKIEEAFPEATLIVRSNRDLRREVLNVFDDTFKVTYALQAIALLISGLTVLNTVFMLMFERTRELGVMRAIGASRRSLAKMVLFESLILGGAAVVGAVVVGLLLSVLLVFVINRFFFGWSVGFILPWETLALTAAGSLVVSILAGLIPGLRAATRMSGSALRYE